MNANQLVPAECGDYVVIQFQNQTVPQLEGVPAPLALNAADSEVLGGMAALEPHANELDAGQASVAPAVAEPPAAPAAVEAPAAPAAPTAPAAAEPLVQEPEEEVAAIIAHPGNNAAAPHGVPGLALLAGPGDPLTAVLIQVTNSMLPLLPPEVMASINQAADQLVDHYMANNPMAAAAASPPPPEEEQVEAASGTGVMIVIGMTLVLGTATVVGGLRYMRRQREAC